MTACRKMAAYKKNYDGTAKASQRNEQMNNEEKLGNVQYYLRANPLSTGEGESVYGGGS